MRLFVYVIRLHCKYMYVLHKYTHIPIYNRINIRIHIFYNCQCNHIWLDNMSKNIYWIVFDHLCMYIVNMPKILPRDAQPYSSAVGRRMLGREGRVYIVIEMLSHLRMTSPTFVFVRRLSNSFITGQLKEYFVVTLR